MEGGGGPGKKIKVIYGIITEIIVNYCNCNCGLYIPPPPATPYLPSPIRISVLIYHPNHCRTGRMRDVIAMALVLLLLLFLSLIQFSFYVFFFNIYTVESI